MCQHYPGVYAWGCSLCMVGFVPPTSPDFPLEQIRKQAQQDAQAALSLDAEISRLSNHRSDLMEKIRQLEDEVEIVERNLVSMQNDRKKYPPR